PELLALPDGIYSPHINSQFNFEIVYGNEIELIKTHIDTLEPTVIVDQTTINITSVYHTVETNLLEITSKHVNRVGFSTDTLEFGYNQHYQINLNREGLEVYDFTLYQFHYDYENENEE